MSRAQPMPTAPWEQRFRTLGFDRDFTLWGFGSSSFQGFRVETWGISTAFAPLPLPFLDEIVPDVGSVRLCAMH